MPNNQPTRDVSAPLAKFCIGVLAGCAAIAIPRLSSFLISAKDVPGDFFPSTYIVGVIIFSVLIGLLVMVMEFKIPRPPKETLFAALAVPGLIAGSLNTAVETQEATRMHEKASGLSKEARNKNGIDIKKIDSMEIIPVDSGNLDNATTHTDNHFSLISSAHAEGITNKLVEQTDAYSVSVQRDPPKYAISLSSADTLDKAVQEVKKIRAQNLPAVLIKTGNQYEVLSSNKLLSETDATIEAIKLKRDFGITPQLLQIK